MNIRELIDIVEGKFRSKDIEDFVPGNDDLDDVKSQYLPDWEMLDHRTLQAKYVAKDHRLALEFVGFINRLSEKMDHFAEVTQDVAEVTVKTSTFDVKGLTILDFKLALYVDRYAEKNNIEQVRMQGNFGMHEGKKDACYTKVKSRVKVWPSAYASGQLVQCRKRGAANWGTGKKK
jgi:pterin-4a-carbinolamine dehydratase